jgi:hypothetical protein
MVASNKRKFQIFHYLHTVVETFMSHDLPKLKLIPNFLSIFFLELGFLSSRRHDGIEIKIPSSLSLVLNKGQPPHCYPALVIGVEGWGRWKHRRKCQHRGRLAKTIWKP